MRNTIIIFAISLLLTGCEKLFMDSDPSATPTATFDYFWKRIDEGYALFDVKDVDWDSVYHRLKIRIYDNMSNDSLFAVLSDMLNTLDDGHVNLWGNNDVFGSEALFLQRYGNGNFDLNTVALHYLTPQYHAAGGLLYNMIADNQVLYIRYSSFSNSASTKNLSTIAAKNPQAKGIVFDIRQNGGGEIQNEWNILSFIESHGQKLYTTQLKSGPAHDEFGEQQIVYAPKNSNGYIWTKPFVILTDRGCYSAASSFALCAKCYDNVIVIGDTTGGGLSIPAGGALPNGWYYRFGISRTIALDGINYENGVPPDRVVRLDQAAIALGKDNIIDSACSLIINYSK